MCWNDSVSLNTFLFSSFVLALIIYNNSFTKYKIQELNNKGVYLFFASVIFMQLVEFFIWRNIHNKFYNRIFSIAALVLLHIQPAASLMIISNLQIRNLLLVSYSLLAIPHLIYNLSTKKIFSEKAENGHLIWNFKIPRINWIVWQFFFFFSFVYEQKWNIFIFGFATFIITFINYMNHRTMGSMWCWVVNSSMIFYACYLLIYLPFLEKMNIC